MTIKRTKIERIVIECSEDEIRQAIQYVRDNGFRHRNGSEVSFYGGPYSPKIGETRYHCEGEKEI